MNLEGGFRETRESGWPLESALPLTRRDPLLWQQLGCSVGRRTCEECRQDPLEAAAAAGVERAQRRVTQEAARKTKGGGKNGHPARSFSQQLDVFHAASDRPVKMLERTRLGVDLFRSNYASHRSFQSERQRLFFANHLLGVAFSREMTRDDILAGKLWK